MNYRQTVATDEKASDELGETGHGCITPTEESTLVDDVAGSGEEAKHDYVRVVGSCIRSRPERRLESDLDILANNMLGEYDEFVEAVREHLLKTGREWRGELKPLNNGVARQAITACAAPENDVDAGEVDAILDAVIEALTQLNARNDDGSE